MRKLRYNDIVFDKFYLRDSKDFVKVLEETDVYDSEIDLSAYDVLDVYMCKECLEKNNLRDEDSVHTYGEIKFKYSCDVDNCDALKIELVRIMIQDEDIVELI